VTSPVGLESTAAQTGPAPAGSGPVIEDLPRPRRIRSPSDVVRLVGALVLLIAGYAAAVALRDGVTTFQAGVLESVASFPDSARTTLVGVTQIAAVAAPAAIVVVLLLRRRFRLLLAVVLAAGLAALGAWLAATFALEDAHPPAWHLTAATENWLAQTSFPSSEYLAAVAAVATVAGAWASRRWRRADDVLLVVLALLRAGTSGTLALDLLFALTAGVAAGAAILLLLGGPDRSPRGADVAVALGGAGIPLARVRQIATGGSLTHAYRADAVDGRVLHLSVRDGEDRRLDLVYRLYTAVRLRSVGEQHLFTSLRQDAEHKAFVALWAGETGVPVPKRLAVTAAGASGILVADEWIDGVRLDRLPPDRLTDDVLRQFWIAIGALHGQRIAHRALRAEIAMVDSSERVWLVGFDEAEVDSPPPHLGGDVAEALASMALVAGPDRAVATAAAALGSEELAKALPYLQPLALSRESQRRLHGKKALLQDLSQRVSDTTGAPPVELAKLERISPRTLAAVLGAFVAMWVLLPKLANAGDAFKALRQAKPGFLLAMLPLTLLLYVGSTFELLGACSVRLSFFATYRCQMAAAFMNRVTPSNVGGMAVNARYLQVSGVDAATATATVGLTSATEAIVNVALVLLFFTWAGRGASGVSLSLPSSAAVRVVVAVVVIALIIFLITPRGRKLFKEKVLPFLKGVRTSLADVGRSPVRLLSMFGGGFGRALTDFVALVIALAAFGPVPAIGPLGAAYIGASVVASASPTPGGVGAVEAALIAGLTSIGVPVAQATPAVLIYRLITYWLVMLPGWISLKMMEKRGEV
jgi:uncharacterized membrane protein YbhN (UPF0104 family)